MRDLIETAESFSYSLLFENAQRAQWLIQQRGAKLEAAYKAEEASIPEITKQQIEQQTGETLPEKLVSFIMAADPTQNKGYSNWIALRLIKNGQKFEDVNQMLSQQLATFQRAAAAKRINGNLDAIHTFSDLFAAVEPFVTGQREVSANMDRKNKRQTGGGTEPDTRVWPINDPMRAHCKVVYDGDDYMILIPTDADGAKYFGKNTNWCTTSGMFDAYSSRGPLYIILRRKDGRKWQFHFETEQFMNERDHPINLDEFIDENGTAFDAIGPEKFFQVNADRIADRRTPLLSVRHFTPEIIASIPDDVLARSILSEADLKAIPRKRALKPAFAKAVFGNKSHRTPEEVLRFYVEAYPNDESFWADMCASSPELLRRLPDRLQTEDLMVVVASVVKNSREYRDYIPKPDIERVKEAYWDHHGGNVWNQHPQTMPERHINRERLIALVATHPTEAPESYIARLDDDGLAEAVENTHFTDISQLVAKIPQERRTKKIAQVVYRASRNLNRKDDQVLRDELLAALSTFDHKYWPTKSPKTISRMFAVSPDFAANLKEFQTKTEAARWVAYEPRRLCEVPHQVLDEEVVDAAFNGAENKPSNVSQWQGRIKSVLTPCDPKVVKPEWVAKSLQKCSVLDHVYDVIPSPYMTDEIKETLARDGALPFDSEFFPADGYTPDNIVARFVKTVPVSQKDTNAKYGFEVIPNVPAMFDAWETIPPAHQTRENLIALVTTKKSCTPTFNRNEILGWNASAWKTSADTKFMPLLTVVDKSLLDAQVLTQWLEHLGTYSYGRTYKAIFDAFPESAHTPENMHLALSKSVIEKVPDHLLTDESIIENILGYTSDRDWSKVTPDIFLKAVKQKPDRAASALRFGEGDVVARLRADPRIALALLRKEKGRDQDYRAGADSKTLQEIYGDNPQARAKWTQDCYDLAAGDIVALKDIPEQFRSDAAITRAIKTDPSHVTDIPDVVEFLRKHPKIDLSKNALNHLLAQGFVEVDGQWLDPSSIKKTTVKGEKGSYAVVKLKSGNAILIFDKDGRCIEALCTDERTAAQHTQYGNHPTFFASRTGSDGGSKTDHIAALMPYRRIIASALEAHPDVAKKFPTWNHGHGGSTDDLKKLSIYPDEDKRYLPVENMKRETIGGLTYVKPGYDQKYYLFDGDGPLMAKIALDSRGSGRSYDGGRYSESRMSDLINRSKDIAKFLAEQGVTSGNNPTFKESFLYTKLGIRGPGKGEWFSLLDEKVLENGENSVWKLGPRYTIANNAVGVIASAKMTKAGFSVEVAPPEDQAEAVDRLFQKVRKSYDK